MPDKTGLELVASLKGSGIAVVMLRASTTRRPPRARWPAAPTRTWSTGRAERGLDQRRLGAAPASSSSRSAATCRSWRTRWCCRRRCRRSSLRQTSPGAAGRARHRRSADHGADPAQRGDRLTHPQGRPVRGAARAGGAQPVERGRDPSRSDAARRRQDRRPGRDPAEAPRTDRERRVECIKRHLVLGDSLLTGTSSRLLTLAAEIARTHHERWDGSGYPNGLAAESIPLSGRIVAVADVFDALCSDRVYRKAMPVSDALALMREDRGRHFDPDLFDRFIAAPDALKQTGASHPDAPLVAPAISQPAFAGAAAARAEAGGGPSTMTLQEAAECCRSLRRRSAAGRTPANRGRRTRGGHRRFPIEEVERIKAAAVASSVEVREVARRASRCCRSPSCSTSGAGRFRSLSFARCTGAGRGLVRLA